MSGPFNFAAKKEKSFYGRPPTSTFGGIRIRVHLWLGRYRWW